MFPTQHGLRILYLRGSTTKEVYEGVGMTHGFHNLPRLEALVFNGFVKQEGQVFTITERGIRYLLEAA